MLWRSLAAQLNLKSSYHFIFTFEAFLCYSYKQSTHFKNAQRQNETSTQTSVSFSCWCMVEYVSSEQSFLVRNANTYTEIGGHRLSPHLGGFFWVADHLHGVHLNTNSRDKHAALMIRPDLGHCNIKCSRFKWDAVHLRHDIFSGLCRNKGIITAGPLPLNGPVGKTQLY